MEAKFFTWKNWNPVDEMSIQFEDCSLVRDIGSFPKGSSIDCIAIFFQEGKMKFYNDDGSEIENGSFSLELNVTD